MLLAFFLILSFNYLNCIHVIRALCNPRCYVFKERIDWWCLIEPRCQGLSSYRPLGKTLLCSLQSAVCALHRPVINEQITTIKPEQTTLNLGEKTCALNVSFTNLINLCSLQVGKYNPMLFNQLCLFSCIDRETWKVGQGVLSRFLKFEARNKC